MVIYRSRVLKTYAISGGEMHPTPFEAWVVFEINGMAIETFHTGIPVAPKEGKEYIVDIDMMTYDIYRINIEEKMLKQITKFPSKDKYGRPWPSIPMYFLMGKVVDLKEGEIEGRKGKMKAMWLKIDCGIEIETRTAEYEALTLRKGDYVAVVGMMYGEIVKEGNENVIQKEKSKR